MLKLINKNYLEGIASITVLDKEKVKFPYDHRPREINVLFNINWYYLFELAISNCYICFSFLY